MKFLRNVFLCCAVLAYSSAAQANWFGGDCCDPCAKTFSGELTASYLYWGIQEDQIGFAIEDLDIFDFTQTVRPPQSNGKIRNHKPKWNSGFRVEGALYSNCWCNGGIRGEYMHIQTKSHEHACSSVDGRPTLGVTAINSIPMGNPFLAAKHAHSKWKTDINEYALDFEYRGCIGSCFIFSPYVGVFGASIDQSQHIVYNDVTLNSFNQNPAQIVDLDVKRKNKFWGVGPRLGLATEWKFWRSASLIADGNVALLCGHFDVKNRVDQATAEVLKSFPNLREKCWRARPMVDGLVGLKWDGQLSSCAGYGFTLSIAYEFQYWWSQWHSCSSLLDGLLSGEGRWGDMSMQGLVVTGGITF